MRDLGERADVVAEKLHDPEQESELRQHDSVLRLPHAFNFDRRGFFKVLGGGLLDRMQTISAAQTFYSGDFLSGCRGSREPAGTLGSAVNQHGSSAALPFAAAVFGASQAQIVAQNVK
jgi:hypothetical protein